MILAEFEDQEELEIVQVKSHWCKMYKIPPNSCGWFCDSVAGLDRCLSGMTNDYN